MIYICIVFIFADMSGYNLWKESERFVVFLTTWTYDTDKYIRFLQLEHMILIHISDSCEATYKSTKSFECLRTNKKKMPISSSSLPVLVNWDVLQKP